MLMKKITLILLTILLSTILGTTFSYATAPSFVSTLQGDPTPSSPDISDTDKDTLNAYTRNTLVTDSDISINFVIDGQNERANKDNDVVASTTQINMTSQTDLENYSKTIVKNNDDFKTVEVADDRISITRVIPSKLFWIFSLPVEEKAEVISWGDQTNQISVNRSWWNIFSKNEISQGEVEDALRLKIKNIPLSQFTTTLDTKTKASILSNIGSTFNASNTVIVITQ